MNSTYIETKTTHKPIDREELESKVRGIIIRGRTVVPGLIGKQVTLTMIDEREFTGACLGFLTVNGDMDVRSPYLTLEEELGGQTVRRNHIPPNKIYAIAEI
jgi:hypothetical protein